MIPFRDNVPCRHMPWMTWTLIGLNFGIFLLTQFLDPPALRDILHLYGLVPARYAHPDWAHWAGYPPGDYRPFVTALFLHGGWLHVVLNQWMLWVFGDNIEDRMGPWRFLGFYLVCGVLSLLLHSFANPDSPLPAVGASGAIAGVLGAYYFLYPYAKLVLWVPVFFLPIFIEVPAIAFLGVWVIIQLAKITAAPDAGASVGDVAWWGHLGGFLAGAALYRLFVRRETEEEKP
ncbi:MAG TPA: rhomboid family intramembrane serine protease [Methylococcaceae bacterium]|nr:rhomboid family intramembrane serine protease [Methylococcaceae bacterium]